MRDKENLVYGRGILRSGRLLLAALALFACDLRQKIVSIPDNVSDFIAVRLPALLADPSTEIYEYASILDYGGYAGDYEMPSSGSGVSGIKSVDYGDYISYASSSDYAMPGAEPKQVQRQTLMEQSKDYGALIVAEKKSFVLSVREIKVDKGDTAYSIAKKYGMPLERLAVLNNLKEPYQLSVGQSLKTETAEIITTKTEISKTDMAPLPSAPAIKTDTHVASSNANVKLPSLPVRAGPKFAWPVKGKIVSDFGQKKSGLNNDGINIGAPLGTAVGVADNGVVAYAGNELKGLGNLIIVQHAGGWMTVYAHLDDFVVKRGDKVSIGQKIGTVGQTGKIGDPQLHFEIRKGSKAHDPKRELR